MDQNRCLLDVIDNPQLLQSFLESETSAETTSNTTNTTTTTVGSSNTNTNQQATNTPAITANNYHVIQTQHPSNFISSSELAQSHTNQAGTVSSETTTTTTTTNLTASGTIDTSTNTSNPTPFGDGFSQSSTASSSQALVIDDAIEEDKHVSSYLAHNNHFQGQINGDDRSSILDPVVSVLDSIITETVAETSPSSRLNDDVSESVASTLAGIVASSTETASVSYSSSTNVAHSSVSPSRAAIDTSSPALDSTPTYNNVAIGNLSRVNDANNNSTSSSDNGSNDLLVDEFYSQHLQSNAAAGDHQNEQYQLHQLSNQMDTLQSGPTVIPSPPKDTITTAFNHQDENISKSQPDVQSDHNQLFQPKSPIQDSKPTMHQAQPEQQQKSQQQSTFVKTEPHSNQQTTLQPSQTPLQSQLSQQIQPQQPLGSLQPQSSQPQQLQQVQQQQPFPSVQPTQPAQQQQSNQILPQTQQQSNTDNKTAPASKKTTKSNTKANTSTAAKPAENKPKRAPRAKKNTKTTSVTTAPTLTQTTTNAPIRPMQAQFITTPQAQQQVIFQNNNGIRQPAMMAHTSMTQSIGGMPQPQRVIQIQTANGPMYFAIAPGPPAGANNNNANNNNVAMNQQQQQQQQTGIQSHQFPTQQICFQSNNNMMMSRPQMTQTMAQQQQRHPSPAQQQQQQTNQHQQMQHQQHHQQMQSSQPQQQQQNQQQTGSNIVVSGHQMIQSPQRLGTPIMAGQTLAIANQQNPHQQHVMLPSSQPMMMPRMSNQIIMNRPMGATGQLLPGQQQYIQILTPNGPMLLALPQQQAQQQPVNNTMIDYNGQVQSGQMSRPMQQQQGMQQKSVDMPDGMNTVTKQPGVGIGKNVANSKSGLDLGDLLMDCGILPEDRTASQSSSSIKSSQSPSLSQISSPMPPNLPQTNSPMPTVDSTSFATHPQQTSQVMPSYGQYQGQPIRITMGPDGQMIMQPAVYGAIRPMMAGGVTQQTHLSASPNIITSSSPMMAMTSSNPSTPNSATDSPSATADNSKKGNAKGKTTGVKRSRSKKSDIDKFPQLKTPKIAQQQQQQQQQHQQQQQQHPHQQQQVAVVPMTFLVGDQSKVLAGSPDVKPNVAQLASGQQVSIAKFVSPVMQTTTMQSPLGSNMMQTSMSQHTNSLATSQVQVINSAQMNTQMMTNSGNSINISNMQQQQQNQMQHQQQNSAPGMTMTSVNQTSTTSGSHMSSSDNPKIEQNGLNTNAGSNQNIKGQIIRNVAGLTTTLVLHPAQAQQRHSISIPNQAQLQQQQLARKRELRAQAILNQLKADQNAALNPQTKQPFRSLEDACKRLLRYHVFDTETVSEAKIREVDEIFDTAAESLLTRKQAIYDKYRYLILKQSMKNVPLSEEVMLEQVFVSDELTYLKKERELFREYEAHLESIALKQARDDTKPEANNDCGSDYFAFGAGSPKQKDQVDQDNAAHSRDVDDWLLPDKWGESRYASVPDSEAATAIESILNEEIS